MIVLVEASPQSTTIFNPVDVVKGSWNRAGLVTPGLSVLAVKANGRITGVIMLLVATAVPDAFVPVTWQVIAWAVGCKSWDCIV